MEAFIKLISSWISQISAKLHLGRDGSIAMLIIFVIVGFSLIFAVIKFLKKKIGTVPTIILVVLILIAMGLLTMSQLKNVAEALGWIYKDGLPSAAEADGDWLIQWFKDLSPGAEEGAGSWVPDKDNPGKW